MAKFIAELQYLDLCVCLEDGPGYIDVFGKAENILKEISGDCVDRANSIGTTKNVIKSTRHAVVSQFSLQTSRNGIY